MTTSSTHSLFGKIRSASGARASAGVKDDAAE
jgi:hypothetical protein